MTVRDELVKVMAMGHEIPTLRALSDFVETSTVFLRDHGHAVLEALRDAERLDWMAFYGASLRIESLHDQKISWQPARWWIDCPVHTGIHSVDDKHRFATFREAIDRAREGNS